jgi:hypothetical protein
MMTPSNFHNWGLRQNRIITQVDSEVNVEVEVYLNIYFY